MKTASQVSTPRRPYGLSMNGQSLRFDKLNRLREIEIDGWNVVALKTLRDEGLNADLWVNGELLRNKFRPHERSNAILWLWRPRKATEPFSLEFRFDDGGNNLIRARIEIHELEASMQAEFFEQKIPAKSLSELKNEREVERRLLIWFDLLSTKWKEFEPVLEEVAKNPPSRLSKRRIKKDLSEVEYIDPDTLTSIIMNPLNLVKSKEKVASALRERLRGRIPTEVITEEKYLEHDVEENRLARHYLDSLGANVKRLIGSVRERDHTLRRNMMLEGETSTNVRGFLLNYLLLKGAEALEKRITRVREDPRLSFLRELEAQDKREFRPFLTRVPHIRKLLQIYSKYLKEGLSHP